MAKQEHEKTAKLKVTLTFTEELLGTCPGKSDLVADYIASKAGVDKVQEELDAAADGAELSEVVDEQTQDSTTIFPKMPDGKPFIYDYQVKGFFKDACGMLRRCKGMKSEKLLAYKKCIDGLVFVSPRQILLQLPDNSSLGVCERPLRAQTPKGDRVCLARSETAPAGTVIEFTIDIMKDAVIGCVDEWLDYGRLRGLGQWRNSGKGKFTFTSE